MFQSFAKLAAGVELQPVEILHTYQDQVSIAGTTIVFNNVEFGISEPDGKRVVFALEVPTNRTVVSIADINGNTPVLWFNSATSSESVEFWYVNLTTETIGTVSVTLDFDPNQLGLDVFKVLNSSATLQDTGQDDVIPVTVTLAVSEGGAVIAAAIQRINTIPDFIWTGTQEGAPFGGFERNLGSTLYVGQGTSTLIAANDPAFVVICESDQAGIRPVKIGAISIRPG